MLHFRSTVSRALLPVVVFVAMVPFDVLAQGHVVPENDLRAELRNAARERQTNVAKVQDFLSSEVAQGALRSMKLDPAAAQKAVPLLSDQELARLAARVDEANFAAGGLTLTTAQVTYLIIAVAVVVIVAILATR